MSVYGRQAGLAALNGPTALASPTASTPLPSMSATMAGMIEAGYATHVFTSYAVTGAVQRLQADGVNWLAIQVPWFQTHSSADVIAPSPTQTPSDRSVTNLIAMAHQAGTRVFSDPFINAEVGSGWQAMFHRRDVQAWFQSYDAYVEHYAKLAQSDRMDLLAIGDEFDSMDSVGAYTPYWDQAIATVRQYYSGPVTCGANYTHYQTVTVWNKLDEVGMDAYFPPSTSTHPPCRHWRPPGTRRPTR